MRSTRAGTRAWTTDSGISTTQASSAYRSAIKTLAVLAVLTWARRRLPVLRADRYAELAWVVLIPLSVVQALVPALVDLTR